MENAADKGNTEMEMDRDAMCACVRMCVHACARIGCVSGVLAWRSHPSLEACCCYIVHVNALMHVCFMALI